MSEILVMMVGCGVLLGSALRRGRGQRHAIRVAMHWALAIALVVSGCSRVGRKIYTPAEFVEKAETWDGKRPVLKLHMRDGGLYVLDTWVVRDEQLVIGVGTSWDITRAMSRKGSFDVPLADVVLAETNVVRPSIAIAGLAILTAASIGLGIYCYTVDKACFGSCPTFYVDQDGKPVLVAEGFSHAIAPSLEATDVDALDDWRPTDRHVTVTMTNEAPETHVVRHVRLLAVPRGEHEHVYQLAGGGFRPGSPVGELVSCDAVEGDCTETLGRPDRVERVSFADDHDLAVREEVALVYADVPADAQLGIAVRFRHSFVTTFLIYQWLAYLGTRAGEALAAFERHPPTDIENGIVALLGDLEFEVWTTQGWQPVGVVAETGPLAIETKLLELPEDAATSGQVRLRMRGAKGFWRVDHVGLVELGARAEAVPIEGDVARRAGTAEPELLRSLSSETRAQTVTFRGDRIDIGFTLPEQPSQYRYFLESRGYYLEWMRTSWLEQEDAAMAAMMVAFPEQALKVLAPRFKELEPQMDAAFWNSRYRPTPEVEK